MMLENCAARPEVTKLSEKVDGSGHCARELRGERKMPNMFSKFVPRSYIRILRLCAFMATTLVSVAFLLIQPAHADWYPGNSTTLNYGADYFGAACYQLESDYGGPCEPVGFTYGTSAYTHVTYPLHYKVRKDSTIYTAYAYSKCPSIYDIPTLYGCVSDPTGLDQQGPTGCTTSDANKSDVDKNGGASCGDPINIATGNLFESAKDFATTGQDALSSIRYYNSDQEYSTTPPPKFTTSESFIYSRFGYGWRSQYDRFIVPNNTTPSSATSVDAIRGDGTPLHFILSGSTWYLAYYAFTSSGWSSSSDPRHGADYRLRTDGTYWYLTDPNDTVDKYDATGKLLSTTYRNGYEQDFTYDSNGNNTVVSDSLGRQISFTYLANGLVDTFTDTDGNVTHFTYLDRSGASAASGNPGLWVLQSVTYPDNSTVTYLYADTHPINHFALTGITDENGHSYASWTYDSTTGRVLSSQLGNGANLTTISYDDTGLTRTVTNALGKVWVYHIAAYQNRYQISSIDGQASSHTAAATTSYQYDSNGFVSQMTDGNGNVTTYTHNSIGEQTSRTEGYGSSVARTITTSWDSTWREPDEIVAPNLTTDFTYDSSGRLTQLTETDTTTQSVPYSTNGETRTWTYTYTSQGLLHTVDGPLSGSGDTITYGYNANGFVNSVTDQLGHVTNITSINGRGQPLTSVDPNGVTTNYTYDLRSRIKTVTVNPGSNQALTSFGYDAAGNLTSITLPDGSILTYAYDDAHRLTSVTNNLSESITYTLDALGNRTATVIKSATGTITKQQSATFDELGRIMESIGAASQTTSYTYDLDNNTVTITDPRNKVYGQAFDALNRLYQQTDPDNYQTTTAYNGNSDVVGVTDARSLTTSYVRDGFGDIIRQTSPDTGITDFWYDANGKLTKKVDARSIETDYTNDNAGRVLTKTFPAASAEDVTYNYDSTSGGNDGVGHLTSVDDESGSSSFVYDALGHVTSVTRVIAGNSYTTAYTYDAAGNILTETYPSGRIVTYTRDALGRISGITTKQNVGATAVTVASGVSYEPFGPLAGLTFGNGIVDTLTYDQDYQLTDMDAVKGLGPVQNLTLGYDPSGNITAITDHQNSARTQSFGYDDLNRLASASGLYGSQSYTYDGVGNRLTRTIGSTTDTYAYSSTANQISTITTGSNVRSFTYLASGQVSQDVRNSSQTYTFAANDNGRMASAALNGSTIGTYLYSAFGQRVQKLTGSGTTQFVFDRFGHLLEVADGSGTVQKEYIWLDNLPVAMVDDTGASPVVYFIQTDQIGSPQKITNANANIVWDGQFDPFGNPVSTAGSPWGTPTQWGSFTWEPASPVPTNLRFPGQYADAETALNQNWNRDYDPTLGRYIESDPIGLAGGINTYAYVNGSPPRYIDPYGLLTVQVGLSLSYSYLGMSGTYAAGFAVDSHGHFGPYWTAGGGTGTGAGLSGGVNFEVSSASTICGLRGPFTELNKGEGLGEYGSGNAFFGNNSRGPIIGAGGTYGVGVGNSASDTMTDTNVSPWW